MHTGTRISVICTLRRRGGRSGALSRRSSLLSAAAALHREEPGEPEDQQVERADHCYSEVQIETRASAADCSHVDC